MISVLEKLNLTQDSVKKSSATTTSSKTPDTTTFNGNPSYSTIGKPHLDFYGGVTRQTDEDRIIELAKQCCEDDLRLAAPTFFQKRNCRGGAGERKPFILAMIQMNESLRRRLYSLIPLYGYWDDLNTLASKLPNDREYLSKLMAGQLLANMVSLSTPGCKVDRNLEKWLPSEGCSDDQKWKAVSSILKEVNALIPEDVQIALRIPAQEQLRGELGSQLQKEAKSQLQEETEKFRVTIADGIFQINAEVTWKSLIPKLTEILNRYNHILQKVQALPITISKLTSPGYRKWLVYRRAHDSVIEHFKSDNNWGMIDYSKVPSIAFDRTKKQFLNHDAERFNQFIQQVKDGKAKINVGRVMPFELVVQPPTDVRDQQWKLVVEETRKFYQTVPEDSVFHPKNSIHVADVSGSMTTSHASKVTPIAVSKSLAILMAEVGQRAIYTFSGKTRRIEPTWSTLTEAVKTLEDPNCNTNFRALIDRIFDDCLKEADKKEISPSKAFPGSIIVYTDGGFDSMCSQNPVSAADYIRNKFESFRKIPVFVFWNVAGNANDFAVQKETPGVLQLAGFSKDLYQLFTRITSPDQLNPESFFRMDVLSEAYRPVLDVFDYWVTESN